MNKSILIIDDNEIQARELCKALQKKLPEWSFSYAYEESDIKAKVITRFYSIAILDLRMDKYEIDGFAAMDNIMSINPFAKIIIVSAYLGEYMPKLSKNTALSKGAILAWSEKKAYEQWIPELATIINDYYSRDINPIAVQILEDMFAKAKNEPDKVRKGKMFEEFVVGLFRQMGFAHIGTRVKDEASNEIDIIVRNDISDTFFSKYGRYIFVECKNKPEDGFSKNDFIVFHKKISSSKGDSNLGVVFTTGYIKRTVKLEALKESCNDVKIIYLSSGEIARLIHTPDMLDEFKEIMDEQVA